jgi:hypothetical protein
VDLANVVAQAPVFLALVDDAGRLVWVSRYAYGIRPEQVLGRPADEYILPADRGLWGLALRRALDLGETITGTVRVNAPGLHVLPRNRFRMAPYRDHAGRTAGVVVVSWDPGGKAEALEDGLPQSLPAGSSSKQQEVAGNSDGAPPHLTALDRRILAAATAAEQTMTALAHHAADHDPDSYFRARVRHLVELGLLVTAYGGYRRA